jgi:glycosyltransferase involved in cell wall biosynthesis/GT2 family glycosyltransferase
MHMLSFSIVINTYNRAESLRTTLLGLLKLGYPRFEIVVVNGPSTDHTSAVLAEFRDRIKVADCPVRNLSVSRNIGICAAAGDLVAFIDDDAIPEPEWLTQLAAGFDSDDIGATGGEVFDHTGYAFQYHYASADRLGNAQWQLTAPTPELNFPDSFRFPYLQGTNVAFRRLALLQIGGFDEEYEYYLDETDTCLRLGDAGWVVRQLPAAYVHHKFLASHVRDENRVAKYRYPVIKNKIYFALKNARSYFSQAEILDDAKRFIEQHFADVEYHIAGGRLTASARQTLKDEAERAWEVGLARGLSAGRELITPAKQEQHRQPFHNALSAAEVARLERRKTIVLLSRDFPPGHSGGVATFTKELATASAALGHTVHVIAESRDVNRVDFEEGVWVHRLLVREFARTPAALERNVPQHIWSWSATALEEVRRIAGHRAVDVVEAPVWDCEGIAVLLDGTWPLVTSLHTPLRFWLDSHPEYRGNAEWMASFGAPMLKLEAELMTASQAVRANSRAIVRDIQAAYGCNLEDERVIVVPHGLTAARGEAGPTSDPTTVLFVGRLESRKGIDVLLQAIPDVLQKAPHLRFRVIGDNTIPAANGKTYQAQFLATPAGRLFANQVSFEGKVDDTVLRDAYASCDIFVAPSRYESFGLVFLEAMREGKPVIGCVAGGIPEIVEDEKVGLLVPPGDAAALAGAILRLADAPELRASLGQKGREVFESRFTAARMAEESELLYSRVKERSAP